MKRFLEKEPQLKSGLGHEKKTKGMVYAASVAAAFWMFGACVATAWAAPTPGASVSDNIVVRDSAVTGAQVGSLVEGQEVTVTGETTGSDGKKWYSITFEVNGGERDGWVRADLIDTNVQTADGDDAETADDAEAAADADEANEDTQDAAQTESGEDTVQDDTETDDAGASDTGLFRVKLTDGYVDLIDVPEDVAATVSDRFVDASLASSAGGLVTCYQLATADALVSNDAILTNYYYVYGTNDIGESGWYVYDSSQGSLQKSTLNMSYSLTDTGDAEEEVSFELSDTERMIVAALGLVCILLLILVIVFSVRYRRLRAILDEEQEDREIRGENTAGTKTAPASKTMEIMDLDDMDDDDYEEMLGKYLDDHIDAEEEPQENAQENSSADAEEVGQKLERQLEQQTEQEEESDDEYYDEEDDDLEFL